MLRNLSWPAVSQIYNFNFFPSTYKVLILKSTPKVAMWVTENFESQNWDKMLVFPTPESPITITFTNQS